MRKLQSLIRRNPKLKAFIDFSIIRAVYGFSIVGLGYLITEVLDLEFNLEGERSECNLQSASFLDGKEHQEIKTRINHLSPNCKSHQKVKNVLNAESKGVYQGKITS